MGKFDTDLPPKPAIGSAWRCLTPGDKPQTRVVVNIHTMAIGYDVDYRVVETGREASATHEQWARWSRRAVSFNDVQPNLPDHVRVAGLIAELERLRAAIGIAIRLTERGTPQKIAEVLKDALVTCRFGEGSGRRA